MKELLVFTEALILLSLVCSGVVTGQSVHIVRGKVEDPEGGAVKSARISLSRDAKELRSATTDDEGRFVINSVAAGRYKLIVKASGFAAYQDEVTVGIVNDSRLKIILSVATLEGEVEVKGERTGLSVEAGANRNAIVLRWDAIRRLPRDEQRLRQLLERMAGSFPGRLNITVNGLSGASLPPSATISEIRINSDPFSAAYHEPGSARVEIETRGGDDLAQGSLYFGYRNSAFDALNTFSKAKAPLEHNDLGGWWSSRLFGPRSFIFGLVERQRHDETIPINPTLPDGPFNANVPTPSKNTSVNLRGDFLLSDRHTFNLFIDHGESHKLGPELTVIDLPERSSEARSSEQNLQAAWRAIFSSNLINEAQLRLTRERSKNVTDNTEAAVEVGGSFNSGGPQCCPESYAAERLSLADNLIFNRGQHLMKLGANVTGAHISGVSERDFGGTFYYPSISFFRLRRPLYYTVSVGEPGLNFGLWRYAAYAQDEIRLAPDFTLSMGLRYETQTYLEDRNNFAPRLGFAWSPFNGQNTVVRGGAGIFYQQLEEGPLSLALRYDGVRQRQVIIDRPRASDPLSGRPFQPSFNKLAADLRTPYQLHSAVSVEQRLIHNLILTVNYNYARGVHLYRSRNINAPPLGAFAALNPDFDRIAQLESSGSSTYQGLTAGFSQSFGDRLSFFGSYTLSRAIDDGDGPDAFPMDSYNLAAERGFSTSDSRHQFFFAALLALPLGFDMSPIVYYGSGRPYNITTGFDNNGDSVVNDRPEGVRRNSERGPNFASVDLRLVKSFGYRRKGSDQQLIGFEVAADATNLFNRVNLVNFIGIQTSPFFRRANAAHEPRQISVQLTFFFH